MRIILPVVVILAAAALLTTCGDSDREVARVAGDWEFEEELTAFPISMVLFQKERHTGGEAMRLALDAYQEIVGGTRFSDVAARASEDVSSVAGGYIGFIRPDQPTRISGAMQALSIGQLSGPVLSDLGTSILYRHDFEEGRRLEELNRIPAQGMIIQFLTPTTPRPGPDFPPREVAKQIAERYHSRIESGEINIMEAARQYDPVTSAPDGQITPVRKIAPDMVYFEPLSKLEPGELAPVIEGPDAFAVLQRGHFFRGIARHILIAHSEARMPVEGAVRTREEAMQRAEEALSKVAKDGSNWNEMVVRYTDDVNSVPLHGSLGCVGNTDLHAALETPLRKMEAGEILDQVIESPQGFHILWRLK